MNYNDPETVPPTWKVGDLILDRYEVKQVFTGGGMGLVYRVHHRDWNMDLAVKSPRPEFFQTRQHIENFEREAETWVNLGLHPHTVSCYYVRRLGGIPRIFTEFVDGGSLADWIRSRRLYEGGPDRAMERILDMAIQFAWGLHYAHEQGLIHQDVKPGNVLVSTDGTVKVTDFGLAKARALAGEIPMSSAGQSILVTSGGMTPAYCSPEQANGKPLSRKTDIWSWAISVFEMFAGEPPCRYGGQLASEVFEAYLETGDGNDLLPLVPPALVGLLKHCFRRDPADRPGTLREAAAELKGIYENTCGRLLPSSEPNAVELTAGGLNNRALSLLDLGRWEDAEMHWNKACDADRSNLDALFNCSLFKLRSEKERPGFGALRKWIVDRFDEFIQTSAVGLARAQLLAELGEFAAAFKHLNWFKRNRRCGQEHDALLAEFKELATYCEPPLHTYCSADCYLSFVSDDWVHVITCERTKDRRNHFKLIVFATSRIIQEIYEDAGSRRASVSANFRFLTSYGKTHPEADTAAFTIWDVFSGQMIGRFDAHVDGYPVVRKVTDDGLMVIYHDNHNIMVATIRPSISITTIGRAESRPNVAVTADGLRLFYSDKNRVLAAATSLPMEVTEVARTQSEIKVLRLLADDRFLLTEAWYPSRKDGPESHLLEVNSWRSVHFSNELDGRALLTPSMRYLVIPHGEVIKIVDLHCAMSVRYLAGHASNIISVCVSPDGQVLASGEYDGIVRLWDFRTGSCRKVFDLKKTPRPRPRTLKFSSCGTRIFIFTQVDTGPPYSIECSIWNVPPSERAWRASFIVSRPLHSKQLAQIDAKYQSLVAAAEHQYAKGDYRECIELLATARQLPGKRQDTRSIDLWGGLYPVLVKKQFLSAWIRAARVPSQAEGYFHFVWQIFRAESEYFALVETANAVVSMRLPDFVPVSTYTKCDDSLLLCEMLGDDRLVMLQGDEDWPHTWGVITSTSLEAPSRVKQCRITEEFSGVCFDSAGEFALFGTVEGEVYVIEIASSTKVQCFKAHEGPIVSLAVSPNGEYLITTSQYPKTGDEPARLWNWKTGSLMGEVDVAAFHDALSFSPDASMVAFYHRDAISFHSLPSLELLHSHRGRSCAGICWWSEDNRFLATRPFGETHLVDYASGAVLRKFRGRVHISSDSRYGVRLTSQLLESYFFDWSLETDRTVKTELP